jgi:hypothetical protein
MSELQREHHDLRRLSAERQEHRAWIGGRIATLLAHYWREDDPDELLGAMGQDWADILEGMTQDAIQKACLRYMREEPRRRPTPGTIYHFAAEEMPKPRLVEPSQPAPPERDRVSAEAAARILADAGFAPKRMPGGDA